MFIGRLHESNGVTLRRTDVVQVHMVVIVVWLVVAHSTVQFSVVVVPDML